MPRVFRARFAAFVVLVLTAAPVWADLWYEHYAAAKKAATRGDWSAVVEELNQALERRGDSGARVRTYGMNVTAYFPYLDLGVAYYHLGQLDAALQAFDTEERLGAIADSKPALAELRRHRRLIEDARAADAAAEAERVRRIVEQSLRQAADLEARGELDAALEAVGRALAVAPESTEAQTALERLRAAVARRDEAAEKAQRVADLRRRGQALLAEGRFEEAARIFRQALAVRPDAGLSDLLDQATERLREDLRRRDDAESAARGLARAESLADAGDLGGALDRLEAVLALDPEHAEARALQERLLARQEQEDGERRRRESVSALLAEAEAHLQAGREEAAVASANRVLALDPGHAAALELVRRAYRRISDRLLGGGPRENLPPAIRFADFREELAGGVSVETVDDPEFRLSGVVIDDAPVSVEILDGRGERLAASVTPQPLGESVVTEFVLRRRLRPGETLFRLTATDPEGASSSSEYRVRYRPPFLRSAGFWALAAAAAGALAAGILALRARRRRRLRRRRFNPYVAGAPVLDDKLFFGRDRLVDRILQTIPNNSLLLHGERRIGKTSLQHHLRRRLAELDDPEFLFHAVYIDLQGTPEERFFKALSDGIFDELAPELDGLEAAASDAGYDHRDFANDLRRVLARLQERSDKKVKLVLLIDEVDELNDYDPRINQKLRSLFMRSFAENLVAVVSGVEINKQWNKVASPWYNFFEEIEVDAIPRREAEALITRPVRGILDFEDGVVDAVLDRTGGKPYLIQKTCMALVNRVHEEGRKRITRADLDAIDGGAP